MLVRMRYRNKIMESNRNANQKQIIHLLVTAYHWLLRH
jgi:hypothetical protein